MIYLNALLFILKYEPCETCIFDQVQGASPERARPSLHLSSQLLQGVCIAPKDYYLLIFCPGQEGFKRSWQLLHLPFAKNVTAVRGDPPFKGGRSKDSVRKETHLYQTLTSSISRQNLVTTHSSLGHCTGNLQALRHECQGLVNWYQSLPSGWVVLLFLLLLVVVMVVMMVLLSPTRTKAWLCGVRVD